MQGRGLSAYLEAEESAEREPDRPLSTQALERWMSGRAALVVGSSVHVVTSRLRMKRGSKERSALAGMRHR